MSTTKCEHFSPEILQSHPLVYIAQCFYSMQWFHLQGSLVILPRYVYGVCTWIDCYYHSES